MENELETVLDEQKQQWSALCEELKPILDKIPSILNKYDKNKDKNSYYDNAISLSISASSEHSYLGISKYNLDEKIVYEAIARDGKEFEWKVEGEEYKLKVQREENRKNSQKEKKNCR